MWGYGIAELASLASVVSRGASILNQEELSVWKFRARRMHQFRTNTAVIYDGSTLGKTYQILFGAVHSAQFVPVKHAPSFSRRE